MIKKFLCILIAFSFAVYLTACSKDSTEKENNKTLEINLKEDCELAFQSYKIKVPDADAVGRIAEITYFDVDADGQDIKVFVPVYNGNYSLEKMETLSNTGLDMAGNIAFDSKLNLSDMKDNVPKEKTVNNYKTMKYSGTLNSTDNKDYSFVFYDMILDEEYRCNVISVSQTEDTKVLEDVCEKIIDTLEKTE
ncbi:MAG: hypothetical protein ACLRT4_13145 [Thomasclavelia sp.]